MTQRETLQDVLGWGNGNVQDHRAPTARFTSIMNAIAAFGQDASEHDGAVLCIQQSYVATNAENTDAGLARLVTLAERQHVTTSPSRNGFQWTWTHVALNSVRVETLDSVYDYLGQLLDCGIRVARLQVNARAAVVHRDTVAHFWRRSVAAHGFDSLTLPDTMDYHAFQSICHALATTTRSSSPQHEVTSYARPLLTIDVGAGAMDLALRWAWLVFALQRARDHSVRNTPRVALSFCGLRLPEARVFAGFVAAHQKRPRFARPHSSSVAVDRFVVLRGRSSVRSDVASTSPTSAVPEAMTLRVVDDISGPFHTGVHWGESPNGIGWVHDVDVVRVDELPRLLPWDGASTLWIDHLTVRLTRRLSVEAVSVVLEAIGARVRRLTLCDGGAKGDLTLFCAALLAMCPSLERLDLAVPVTSLDWLRACRQLRVLTLKVDGIDIRPLLHALTDRGHVLSQRLTELHMDWETVAQYLDEFLAMLAVNTRLEKCILFVYDPLACGRRASAAGRVSRLQRRAAFRNAMSTGVPKRVCTGVGHDIQSSTDAVP